MVSQKATDTMDEEYLTNATVEISETVMLLTLICGIPLNIISLIVLIKSAQLKNNATILFITLTASDLVMLCFAVVGVVFDVLYYTAIISDYSISMASFFGQFVITLNLETSKVVVVLISLDRFIAVWFPVAYTHVWTTRKVKVAIVVSLVFVALANILKPFVFTATSMTPNGTNTSQIYLVPTDFGSKISMYIAVVDLMFVVIPVTLVFILSIFTVLKLRKRFNGITFNPNAPSKIPRMMKDIKTTRLILCIASLFAILHMPIIIFMLVNIRKMDILEVYSRWSVDSWDIVTFLCFYLEILNACLNCVMFIIISPTYKETFKRTFVSQCALAQNSEQ